MVTSLSEKIVGSSVLIILFILIFQGINNYIVLSLDTTFPTYDEMDNLRSAYNISNFFSSFDSKDGSWDWYYDFFRGTRPPLYRIFLALGFVFFKFDADYFTMLNIIYLAVILFSVYGIGKVIMSREAGLMAAFIVSMFPGMFAMSRVLMIDFPLTAMVCLSIYLMLRTKNFSSFKYSILFGASIGLGLLTKVTFIVFVLPVLLIYLFFSVKYFFKNKIDFRLMLKNILLSMILSLITCILWYLPNLSMIIARAKANATGIITDPDAISIYYYLSPLIHNNIGAVFYSLFICSCLFLFIKYRKMKRDILLILCWFIAPFLLFSLSPNKQPRFLLPLLPSVGIIISFGLNSIKRDLIRKTTCVIVIIFSLFMFFMISYGKLTPNILVDQFPLYSQRRINYGIYNPLRIDWKTDRIADLIISDIEHKQYDRHQISILSLINIGEINNVLEYDLIKAGYNVEVSCPAAADFFDSPTPKDFPEITDFQYIINKDKYLGENNGDIDWISILNDRFQDKKDKFSLLGVIEGLPDDSKIFVFKRKDDK